MLPKRNTTQYVSEWQLITLGMTIPLLLGAGPVVGYFLGQALGGLLGSPGIGGAVGLIIGFIAGIRETVRIVKRLITITNKKQ